VVKAAAVTSCLRWHGAFGLLGQDVSADEGPSHQLRIEMASQGLAPPTLGQSCA
jgi:hypothetical protein